MVSACDFGACGRPEGGVPRRPRPQRRAKGSRADDDSGKVPWPRSGCLVSRHGIDDRGRGFPEALRRRRSAGRPGSGGPVGQGARGAGTQRCRQDHADPHHLHAHPTHRRDAEGRRHRRGEAPEAGASQHRARRAVRRGRARADLARTCARWRDCSVTTATRVRRQPMRCSTRWAHRGRRPVGAHVSGGMQRRLDLGQPRGDRSCSSSTSRPPVSTREPQRAVVAIEDLVANGTDVLSPPSTSTRPTASRHHRDHRPRQARGLGHRRRAEGAARS